MSRPAQLLAYLIASLGTTLFVGAQTRRSSAVLSFTLLMTRPSSVRLARR